MADQIQIRGDLAAVWALVDPTPADREPCLETDTGKLKFGNAVDPYSALPYFALDLATVSGILALVNGGTGADLSASGPGVAVQDAPGDPLSVRALVAGDIPAGIPAASIGSGSVDNTELGYLDGVTSSLQTQLNGKAASAHTHAAADITSGTLALARGGTNADLSASGGATHFLGQDASHVVSARAIAAADLPNHSAALLTSGTVPLAQISGLLTGNLAAAAGILGSQLAAAAGIVSGQIADVALSKLTAGTLGVDLAIDPSKKIDWGTAAGTGTVSGSSAQIVRTSTGVATNVPSGQAAEVRVAGSVALTQGVNGVAFNTNTGGSTAGAPSVYRDSGDTLYVANPIASTSVVIRAGGTAFSNWVAQFQTSGFTLFAAPVWFTGNSRASSNATSGTAISADGNNGNLFLNAASTKGVQLSVAGTTEYTFDAAAFTLADANNIAVGTTTGTKIGTGTTQKLAFWNATPIVQPATGGAAATRVGGGGTALTDSDTFDGYSLAQVVKALRNAGLLA